MDRVDADVLQAGRKWRQLLARHRRGQAAEELHEPGAARVHDPGLTQDLQILRGAGERVLPALNECAQQLRDGQVRRRTGLRLLGELADHGQHRSLDRRAHCAVGGVARRAEGPREQRRVDRLRLPDHLGEAAHDLGEDHPRVPARAHQRRTRDLAREPLPVVLVELLQRLPHRPDGQSEVRAGVAVRYGIDVQVVDPLPARLERRGGRPGEPADGLEIAHEPGRSPLLRSARATSARSSDRDDATRVDDRSPGRSGSERRSLDGIATPIASAELDEVRVKSTARG